MVRTEAPFHCVQMARGASYLARYAGWWYDGTLLHSFFELYHGGDKNSSKFWVNFVVSGLILTSN